MIYILGYIIILLIFQPPYKGLQALVQNTLIPCLYLIQTILEIWFSNHSNLEAVGHKCAAVIRVRRLILGIGRIILY